MLSTVLSTVMSSVLSLSPSLSFSPLVGVQERKCRLTFCLQA